MRLRNKISIITGGGRGIGLGIANKFLDEGAEVIVFDVMEKPENYNKQIKYYRIDISNFEEVGSVIDKIIRDFKKIDILVNNAGVIEIKPFLDIDETGWDKIFNVDCKGVFICSQKVIPHMLKNKSGSIINISSIAGHVVRTNHAHYCAAKAAVIHLTKCLAVEFAPYNIRINCICPGKTSSEMLEGILKNESIDKNKIIQNIPLRKLAMEKDIANVATFLASEEASHIIGQIINVDGGQSLNYVY